MRTVQVQTVGRFSLANASGFDPSAAFGRLKMLVVALLALGVLLMARTEPLVPPAAAGTVVELTGNGPPGYFPDLFEQTLCRSRPFHPSCSRRGQAGLA